MVPYHTTVGKRSLHDNSIDSLFLSVTIVKEVTIVFPMKNSGMVVSSIMYREQNSVSPEDRAAESLTQGSRLVEEIV